MGILSNRRKALAFCFSCVVVFLLFSQWPVQPLERFREPTHLPRPQPVLPKIDLNDGKFHWANVLQHYPVTSFRSIPEPSSQRIPRIQFAFRTESPQARQQRLHRLQVVKDHFTHAFTGYEKFAWLQDEVAPLSGRSFNHFGGWAATLVDSLDTLWIMGMKDQFTHAVEALDQIDFSTCSLDEINVFETTIRYLGGFLSAYDLSNEQFPSLLTKAIEMGDMLYFAFDTPNRMPITRWNFKAAARGATQIAPEGILLAELGSLTLEFTRLSQVTGDPKYYDAVQRIMDIFEEQQNATKLPGMWPVVVNAKDLDLTGATGFTIGGMADSTYEYLPKQYLLLGGAADQYRKLYEAANQAIKRNILYRPMTPNNLDILFAGQVDSDGALRPESLTTEPQAQHLGCFAGGMLALASKIFSNQEDLVVARKLVEGCLWAYEAFPLGIMPEIMHTVPCKDRNHCPWDEQAWKDAVTTSFEDWKAPEERIQSERLVPGVTKIDDRRYILRPEAIESAFVLYRITGDQSLPDRAWNMFNAIVSNTMTDIAHAALDDCTIRNPPKADRMESFWMAETLKYFYLIFSEPGVVSLDDYVLNTEAHPLRRPWV